MLINFEQCPTTIMLINFGKCVIDIDFCGPYGYSLHYFAVF